MLRLIAASMLTLMTAMTVTAADNKAQTLYQKHCTSCHNEDVMTRSNRVVKDHKQLRSQVQRCELSLGLRWFDEDIDRVTDHLNINYYKFTK